MIGTSPRRKEDRRLLTGQGRFLDDVTRPGMLALGVVRSVHAHARVVNVDARAARELPGVVAVWTAADLPEVSRGIAGPQKGRPYVLPVLARDVVRFVGEPVGVVVAENAYRLADALERVAVEYALPHAADLPGFSVELIEHPSTINPLGVKGVGESGAIPGAAAIANAVEDALAEFGVTIREVPVTATRLFDLLAARRTARGR